MTDQCKHLLFTGSSGFVGRSYLGRPKLGQHLFDGQSGGQRITGLDRVPSGNGATIVGDLRDPEVFARLPEGIDAVVHAAAALPSHDRDEIFDTDVRGTARLLRWAARSGVRHFVHISSTAVYGPHHPLRVTEDTPKRPFDAYNTAKARAEDLVPAVLDGTDTRWTILRPKAIVGPGRMGLFGQLFDFAASGHSFPVIGDGHAVYQFLHSDDLSDAIDLTLAQPDAAHGATLNIASDADHSIAELFQSVLDMAGHGKRLTHVPESLARPVLLGANALGLSPVYARLVSNLVHGSTVSLDAARTAIGYVPKHNGHSALADAFAWYRAELVGKRGFTSGSGHREIWGSPLASLVRKFI